MLNIELSVSQSANLEIFRRQLKELSREALEKIALEAIEIRMRYQNAFVQAVKEGTIF